MIPSVWRKGILNPIPKSSMSDAYNPIQYRGISLLSNVSKVYCSILNKRIMHYCEFLDIYVDEQNGFRAKRSCEDHVYVLNTVIRSQLSRGKSIFVAFVDMEKAFDWVDRGLLLYRLLQYNIDGKMYQAIKNYYSQTESCVKLNNMYSEWFQINSGVRQGDPLSPTLFSLYINELAKEIKSMHIGVKFAGLLFNVLLYADDLVLMASSERELQSMLNTVAEWCKQWRLKVNCKKTNIVHFRGKRKRKTNAVFKYNNVKIDVISEYKYLGVIFDEYLSFEKCSKTLAESGGRALGLIWSNFKSMSDVGYKTYLKMYETGVVSITDYGSGVWGTNKVNHAELVQNKAIRYFLGVHNFTAVSALHGEMGWLPCKYRKHLNVLRLWNRLVKMTPDRITKQTFTADYNDNYENWTSSVREILSSINMVHIYNQKICCNLEVCRNALFQFAQTEWLNNMQSKPKLRTYVKFKSDFKTESYVSNLYRRYQRSLVAKLRCGILQLHIESGRFNQTPLEERTCEICQSNSVEDEIHFVCVCPVYSDLRVKLYTSMLEQFPNLQNLSNMDKFVCIVNNGGLPLADFIHNAWALRTDVLYTRNEN